MPRSRISTFLKADTGAVAATYALALTGLLMIGGVAFDYGRMVAMDTELQSAADQAALAAVTQLDGSADSINRAVAQASGLVSNISILAGGTNKGVTIASVVFFSNKADAEAGTNSFTDNALSANARFVRVTVDGRQAFYAFTPIVGAARSDSIAAMATAGIGSAICKVPPLMMCNPNESTDPGFTLDYIGKGIKLVSVGAGGAWSPGNFGYLDTGASNPNKIEELKVALGWESPPGDCLPQSGVDTSTGANTPVTHALNTRFDIYENGGPGGGACVTGGTCRPSINTIKDLIRKPSDGCGTGNNNWAIPTTPYLPDPTTRVSATPTAMGLPRDICHAVSAAGDCTPNEKIGDKNWDRATYFAVNYPGIAWQSLMTAEYGTTAVTRYQVYRWEIKNKDTIIAPLTQKLNAARVAEGPGKGKGAASSYSYPAPTCSASGGVNPLTDGIDRRTFPIAVVNCTANSVNGTSDNVAVLKWMNVFIVEPSIQRARTGQQDVYVEPVSVNTIGNSDGGSATVVRRDKPYLIN